MKKYSNNWWEWAMITPSLCYILWSYWLGTFVPSKRDGDIDESH